MDPLKQEPEHGLGEGSGSRKKAYEQPELVEWGRILEMTHGAKSGTKDFPLKGGTTGV